MKRLVALMMCAVSLGAEAQIIPNPDFENDGSVGIEDLLELLAVYGLSFQPNPILLDGVEIENWLYQQTAILLEQQQVQDSLGQLLTQLQQSQMTFDSLQLQLDGDTLRLLPTESAVLLPIANNSNSSSPNDTEIDPIGILDETFLPEPQNNGCTQRAILRDDLNMDAWYDDPTLGATAEMVFFLDGYLRLWTVQGDNNASLYSSLPFGFSFLLEGCGSPCGMNCTGGVSNILNYVSDSLVVLGVGFNRNINCGQLKGVHVIRPNGDNDHILFDPPNPGNVWGPLWGDVQFDYPWIIWERSYGDSKFFFNLISHEYTSIQNFGDNGNGVLHDGKLFYVDTDQSQANSPEYGWLKSYNLGNHGTTLLLDLKTVSNSNFYEVSGNGAEYALSFDFTLAAGTEGLAIFKDYNGEREGQVILCGFDGIFPSEYQIETWDGTLPIPTTHRYNSNGDLGFT